MFTGRAPLFSLYGGFSAYGLATRTLQCGTLPTDAGLAPAFHPDFQSPPLACAGGQTFGGATTGEIDVLDRHLRLPQTMRGSLAMDAELPFGVVGTIEGLYTRATNALFYSPVNLSAPVGPDPRAVEPRSVDVPGQGAALTHTLPPASITRITLQLS